jgi:hypothetical protein
MKLGLAVLIGALAVTPALAASPEATPEATAIGNLSSCDHNIILRTQMKLERQRGLMNRDNSAETHYADYLATVYQCIDDNLKPAIAAAGDHTDLKDAIKTYYIKARAYVGSWDSPSEDTSESEESQAWDRVRMERKIAGIQ